MDLLFKPQTSGDTLPAAAAAAGDGASALDRLMQRMQATSDFPALTRAVSRIQRVAASETESAASLAAEILQDVALTHKLLRMVNTVHYSSAAGGRVSTVSRAVALVGFAGIRNMALSLVLLEGLRDPAQAALLRDEFVLALVASHMARELTLVPADAEEAYLAALFHHLGRLLTTYYLPDEARAVAQLFGTQPGAAPAQGIESAARQVLGVSFETLGVGVARSWGLPDELRHALRRPTGAVPARVLRRGSERNAWLSRLANDAAHAMQMPEREAGRQQLHQLASQYASALGLRFDDIVDAAEHARQAVSQIAPAIGLVPLPGSAAQRVFSFGRGGAAELAAVQVEDLAQAAVAAPAVAVADQAPPPAAAVVPGNDAADLLAAGIQDVMNTLAGDDFKLDAALQMILETLLRALRLRRVVLCLREPKSALLVGRYALGTNATALASRFVVNPAPPAGTAVDLFGAVCLRVVDTFIANAEEANIQARLPAWYTGELVAPSFLLLPLAMKDSTFALLYADVAQPGALMLGEREMALVRVLRSQAVMAFRQAG